MEDIVNTVKTKFAPFRCPNCNGWGTVTFKKVTCHACNGKGFVIIDQETGDIKEVSHGKSTT